MQWDQSEQPMARRQKDLPTFYYHAHFIEMLDFVTEHYPHALADEHRELVRDFRALTPDEQRLYVRLVNRKGRVFDAGKLRYPELGSLPPLLASLRARGWLVLPQAEDYAAVLKFLKRAEIQAILLELLPGVSRTLKKAELVELALGHVAAADFIGALNTDRLVVQGRCRGVRYLLFLFFGRLQDGLSQFTMRDLGLVRTSGRSGHYEPRFAERPEAEAQFRYAELERLVAAADGDALERLAGEVGNWPAADFSGVAASRDRVLEKLGRKLERQRMPTVALRVYEQGESAACNERVVRILLANGERERAKAFLEQCIDAPRSDEEWLFATDLYARKFASKRTSVSTDRLREAELIDIDESLSGSPERAVASWFESAGARAFRVENALWRSFFGLLFWQEIASAAGGTTSPFDSLPLALTDGSFRQRHAARVADRLALLEDRALLKRELLKTGTSAYGTPNGVFRWRRRTLDAVFALADHAEPGSLVAMLDLFIDHYLDARYGYPDLMLVDDEGLRFVEVKAEGDALRRNQLLRLEQLRHAGFRADVIRVRWVLDARQDYVVVDVETTGGRGEHHRVTEIGAVKVRDGRVVDEFSTLLNPQRSIPPGITRLTGITPEMVVNAPYFADVADDFERFLDGAIFVAHNVEFDYGFIGREFARLGRRFRMPKLCTVASMRKLYPGRASYSLANLCRDFGVALDNHHRALCDARAAAELLVLVNEKRAENLAGESSA